MRAVMVCYQLSNLLLYKHELLLSKCPLTADWLLIRPVWNEISNEPLNYDPIPEHIISHTYYTLPLSLPSVYFCLLSFYLVASSVYFVPRGCSSLLLHICPYLTSCSSAFLLSSLARSQSVTAVGDQTSVCSTWSSTGALAVGGAVWAAETTLLDPIVSDAERTTTGDPPKSLACPATAISMVNSRYKTLNCFDNNLRILIIIHAKSFTHYFCFLWHENI